MLKVREKSFKREAEKPFMLITVDNGVVLTERFDSLQAAQQEMLDEFLQISQSLKNESCRSVQEWEKEADSIDCGFSLLEHSAYSRKDKEAYSWQIVKVF